MANTFKDYSSQILEKIPIARKNDATGFLVKPSPAQLRNYCDFLLTAKMSNDDIKTLKSFLLTTNDNDEVAILLKKVDIDKFRPIQNFLEGKILNPAPIIIEMTAILIDFKPRPYFKFQKGKNLESKIDDSTEKSKNEENKEKEIVDGNIKKKPTFIKIAAGVLGLAGISSIGFVNFKNDAQTNCMQWKDNHYERVDCNLNTTSNLYEQNPIEIYSPEVYELKKINVDENTVFFKNGKATVFYLKINDSVLEYYNRAGFHPVSNKPLKPITKYMITKYVKNQKK